MAAVESLGGDGEPAVYIAPMAPEAAGPALALARRLRSAGRTVEVGSSDKKLKAQLKRADKISAGWAVLVGEDELAAGNVTVRNLIARSDHPACFALDATAEDIQSALEGTN